MKKFFSLAAGIFLSAAVFAAGRGPVVTVNSYSDYKIVIDGRSYFGNNITLNLDNYYGTDHNIRVYEMRRGFFGNREVLVSSSNFRADRNDVVINIDRYGYIDVREVYNYGGGYDQYDRDNRYNRGWGNRGRGWGGDRDRDRDDDDRRRGNDRDRCHNDGGYNRRF